jgi:hypothetical protein
MRRPFLPACLFILSAHSVYAGYEAAAGEPVLGPAPGNQYEVTVATDGTEYLVVWRDWRSGTFERLMATRISADGEVLDPLGVTLAAGSFYFHPRVTWSGHTWEIGWSSTWEARRLSLRRGRPAAGSRCWSGSTAKA